MAIIMIFTMVPATIITLSADDDLPMMKQYGAGTVDYRAYYASIYSATFLDVIDWNIINAPDTVAYWRFFQPEAIGREARKSHTVSQTAS